MHGGQPGCTGTQVFLMLDSEAKRELSSLQSQLDAVKALVAQVERQNIASGGAAGG